VLVEVSKTNVYCANPELIGGLLLGVEGSPVEIGLKRMSTGTVHQIRITSHSHSTKVCVHACIPVILAAHVACRTYLNHT
jgi:hypothetical protein